MSRLIQQGQFDYRIRGLAEGLVGGLFPHDYLSEYAAILNWVRKNVRYTRDPRTIEQIQMPAITVETKQGDCVTTDTKIIVVDARGHYRVKALSELRDDYHLYQALSYDFSSQRWVFKPITAWLDKGEQETYRVVQTTGYTFRCTAGHDLLLWSQKKELWEERTLADACGQLHENGARSLKQNWTLLAARQIPCLEQPSEYNDDLAWLAGAYTAEGWSDATHCGIARSGEDRVDVTRRLDALGMTYLVRDARPGTGGYINVHQHALRPLLSVCGRCAKEKHFPWDLLSAPLPLLQKLFDGYVWGDTWVNPRVGDKTRSHSSHVLMHSTISDELALQLKLAHLIFGRPLSGGGTPVVNHGGLGKNPIWRLWEATGAHYQERMPQLTNIGVRRVEYAGVAPVCDITVADTHNFVLADGTLVHNCDDSSVLIGALVGAVGAQVRLVAGAFASSPKHPRNGQPLLSHVWLEAYEPASAAWVVLDPVPGRKVNQMLGRLTRTTAMEVLS